MRQLLWKSLRRNLQQNRTLFLFTVLGVALGVASVVAIQTLNQGAMQAFDGSVKAISGQAELSVQGLAGNFDETNLVQVLADPAVQSAWPLCRVDVAVKGQPGFFLEVVGVDLLAPVQWPLQDQDQGGRQKTSTREVLSALLTPGWVALTPDLARQQGWAVGDTVQVSSGSRQATLTVGALVDFQALEPLAPKNLALMDIHSVQSRLTRPHLLQQIDIRLRENQDLNQVKARLGQTLGAGLKVVTPEQRSQDAKGLLAAFRLNLTALSLISVFVGVFLVLTSVQASLARRRGEFGLLRCLGATAGQVVWLVVLETAVLGLLGVAVGIPLGYLVALNNLETVSATLTNIYVLQGISRLVLPWPVVLLGALVGLVGSTLGALWPALELARRDTLSLMSPVSLQQKTSGSVGRLTWLAVVLAVGSSGWFFTQGTSSLWGGFVYAAVMMLALPLCVPLVVKVLAGSVRPRNLGFGFSLRNLSARLHNTSFAVAALAVTVSMLVGITLLVGSFRTTLINWLDVTLRADIYVTTESWERAGGEAFLQQELIDELRNHPGIAGLEEQRRFRIATADGSRLIWLNGIGQDDAAHTDLASRLPLRSGDAVAVAAALDRGGIMIGEPLARKAKLAVGDTLRLAGPNGPWLLPIAGVAYDYTSEGGTGFITMETLHRVFPAEPTNNVALFLEDPGTADQLVSELKLRYDNQPLVIRSNVVLRQDVLAVFDQTFAVTRTLQTLALIIAVLGVAMNLLVQTRERAGELALLRSLGAARNQIFRLFVGEGVAMGLTGLAMGLVGGVGLAALLILVVNRTWFGWTIHPAWPGMDLLVQAVLVLSASTVASLYPASRAGLAGPEQLTRDNL